MSEIAGENKRLKFKEKKGEVLSFMEGDVKRGDFGGNVLKFVNKAL